MKNMSWIFALAICSGNALLAQSFPGTWQGAMILQPIQSPELQPALECDCGYPRQACHPNRIWLIHFGYVAADRSAGGWVGWR
jgi:hypothetical protein